MTTTSKTADSLKARGIYETNIREAMSEHPVWIQDECIEWAIGCGWTFTGTQAVVSGFFRR